MTLRALVIGSNGQDGSYLAEVLLERGYAVAGVARQARTRFVSDPRFRHFALDLCDPGGLASLLETVAPDRIFYLAAVHGPAGFAYESRWQEALKVNVAGLHVCLEHLRRYAARARLFYASSIKVFGSPYPAVISEATSRVSRDLYSISKNAADDLIGYYRRTHGLHASVGYLFNHDSPRRPPGYFLPLIAEAIAAAMTGSKARTSVASLNFACDWGSSREFMEFAVDLLDLDEPDNLIFATGETWRAGDLVDLLFRRAGLDWQAFLDVAAPPAPTVAIYRGDLSRFVAKLGRRPQETAPEIVAWILQDRFGLVLPSRLVAQSP
jgi:GDPmannose 4,6-dehydratase